MPYLAATELTLRLPANVSIGTDTTPISIGEVGSIIGEVGARFDAVAAKSGYAIPVSSTASAWPMVQQIIRDGAGARVLRILFWGPGSPPLTTAEEWEKAYEDALKAILEGELVLPGVPEEGGESIRLLPRSFSTTSVGIAGDLERGASVYVPRTWEP